MMSKQWEGFCGDRKWGHCGCHHWGLHLEQPHLFLGQWCLAIHNQPVPLAAPVAVLGCCAQGWKEVTARYTLPFLVTESLY